MPRKTPLESWIETKIGANAEQLTRQKIDEYQVNKLRETIRWARSQSPFYARRLGGFSESQLTSLEDLRRFPFTTASDLHENNLQFLCVSQSDINRVVTLESSGTSGKLKRVYFTAEDQELTLDFFQLGISTFVQPGETVLIALPGGRPGSVGDLLAKALRRLGARPVVYGFVDDPFSVLNLTGREAVDCIVGLPVQILSLIRCQNDFATRSPSRVLLCSDHVSDSIVRAIKRAWHSEVFEHYGMTEMGLGGGVDCEAHSGYHLREADLYFEIVDPESGSPMPDGHLGEVVFTTLTRRGMPFIRYRTGDISRFLPGKCECGSILRCLERIRYRATGVVSVGAHEEITIAELDEALFEIPQLKDFAAELARGEPSVLNITAFVAANRNDGMRGILKALNKIPSIYAAENSGQLKIDLNISHRERPVSGRKRMIMERVA